MYDDYRHLIREHVFDKCWQLDITWAELDVLIDSGQVIESHDLGEAGLKEIRLLLEWKLPLHLVYVLNERKHLVIYRTVYVPDAAHWQPGYRERRRP
jgi:hypothetical protein